MRSSSILALASILSLAFASQNSTAASSDTYTIDPNSVPLSTRQSWCSSQTSNCPLICLQTAGNTLTPESNTCNATLLTYTCVCSNGISPNASQYSETLPYFICSEWGNQCVTNCGSKSQCAADCRDNHPCGAQDPERIDTSTVSATMQATATSSVYDGAHTNKAGQTIYSGFGGSAAATGSSKGSGAPAAVDVGRVFGVVVLVAGLVGGFAVLL